MSRIARSLDVLRDQVNELYPGRSEESDGWIGDARHQATKSDHNPNVYDVVQALDITHDPTHGLDAGGLADTLIASQDHRIKYVISNRRIANYEAKNGAMPWAWRPYTGPNAHEKHVHISVRDEPEIYDSTEQWKLTSALIPEQLPSFDIADSAELARMAKAITSYEDYKRPYRVYKVTDGTNEILGINEKAHPDYFKKLNALIGNDAAIEKEVSQFIIDYTNQAAQWTHDSPIEFYLRDCIFNRGPSGAAIILQKAVGAAQDGAVGPNTKAAVRKFTWSVLLDKLRKAREEYELEKYGRREKLWKGLVSRWDKALADAKSFEEKDIPTVTQPSTVPSVTIPGIPATPVLPLPPASASAIDWDKVKWAYSLDRAKLVASLKEAIVMLGETPEQLIVRRKQEHEMTELVTPAVVQVVPFYKKKTFWVTAVSIAAAAVGLLSKNVITLDQTTQDVIVNIVLTLLGGGAGTAMYTAMTSKTVTPTGAERARAE